MALTSCTVPQAGRPTFDLPAGEMEIGIGIHGEPGRTRLALRPAAEIAELLAGPILDDLPFRRGDGVLAFVNGMGGTPLIELYVMYHELARICADRGITIVRNLVGSYITSLDMAGCSITLLRMDDELAGLLDAGAAMGGLAQGGAHDDPTRGPVRGAIVAWLVAYRLAANKDHLTQLDSASVMPTGGAHDGPTDIRAAQRPDIVAWLVAYADALAANKDYLTELDSAIGDADHGINMDRGFQAVVAKLTAQLHTRPAAPARATSARPSRAPA